MRLTLLLLLVAALSSGCITRTIRTKVYDHERVSVILRSQAKGTQTIDREFEHPVTIAAVRLAHILSNIDVRKSASAGSKREPAIPTEILFATAEGLSKGLAQANSSQEVVVMAIRRTKSLAIFDHQHLTSFLAYRRDDLLYIHLSHIDWEIPERREDRLPEPDIGVQEMRFRVLASDKMVPVDAQAVAVYWRDPYFKKPSRTRITPGGRVVRRTILMESSEEEIAGASAPVVPDDLSPDTLRALADLEEQRRRGDVSEAQYAARRAEILGAN